MWRKWQKYPEITALKDVVCLLAASFLQTHLIFFSSWDLMTPFFLYLTRHSSLPRALFLAVVAGYLVEVSSLAPQMLYILIYWLLALASSIKDKVQPSQKVYLTYCGGPLVVGVWISSALYLLSPHLLHRAHTLMMDLWLSLLTQLVSTVVLMQLIQTFGSLSARQSKLPGSASSTSDFLVEKP